MITLYGFGPAFGLPDMSPFVTKAEVLLKMSGLPYRVEAGNLGKSPKHKLPYIDDDGTIVPDSTLIRMHLEARHGIDFDKGLSPAEKGTAWALEKMLEDHVYWIGARELWLDDASFDKGPRKFFDEKVPALIRPLVVAMVRRQVRRNLRGQGMGRFSPEEAERISARAVAAAAAVLGEREWLGGTRPAGADATLLAFVASLLCPHFDTPSRRQAQRHANLVAYRDRGMARFYPELAAAKGMSSQVG